MIICPFCRSSRTKMRGQKAVEEEDSKGRKREYAEQTWYCRDCCKIFTVKMV